jgi:surface antigen
MPRFTRKGGILCLVTVALPALGLSGCVVYEAPAPYYASAANSSSNQSTASTGQTCREYRTTAAIDGKPQEIHGTACLQPDGTWQFRH